MIDESRNLGVTEENQENQQKSQVIEETRTRKIPSVVLLTSIILGVILLLSFGGWLVYKQFFAVYQDEKTTNSSEIRSSDAPAGNFFVNVPDIVVNLRSTKPKGNILRTTLLLQIYRKEDELKAKELMPIILDQALSYLRDQSVNDLEGPGLERMRQALLLRINNILRPMKIHRVILKDFIIQ